MGESARSRRRTLAVAASAAAGVVLWHAVASGLPTVPAPSPIAIVKTTSGSVTKTTLVPIGGVPVPIDVDDGRLLGVLTPDVDVAVGLIAAEELPDHPLVPNIEITRNALAVTRNTPAPPLRITVGIEILDVANGLQNIASVAYGYDTGPQGRAPTRFKTKLLGPIAGGFVDPLVATVETPGYRAPLSVVVDAATTTLEADIAARFDPLPESVRLVADPREDGLDASYEHAGPVDVKLDAAAKLHDRVSGQRHEIAAVVERLPQFISLSDTTHAERTVVEYRHSSALRQPDLTGRYTQKDAAGNVVTAARIDVAGLPAHMRGTVRTSGDSVQAADFRVLDGEEIGSVDFDVRNWAGDAGDVPVPDLAPTPYVAAATRGARYRAAGHLEHIRSIAFERVGDGLDLRTDIGDGVQSLRTLFDLDDRSAGTGRRIAVDSTIQPLPRQIHARFEPATGGEPTQLLYEASATVDVEARATLADGPADGCGEPAVTCVEARINNLPPTLSVVLPGQGGTDVAISAAGATTRPDVNAMLDRTAPEGERVWLDATLRRLPTEIRARIAMPDQAEFHACDFDYEAGSCRDVQQALGSVEFVTRDRPERSGLPVLRDHAPTFVSFLRRGPHTEIAGRVDEIRHVAFQQRSGAEAPTIGALVDAGVGGPFDVRVDDADGTSATRLHAHVAALPTRFTACARMAAGVAPSDPSDAIALLEPCEPASVLSRPVGDLDATPLSLAYDASAPTRVTATAELEAPDPEDGGRTRIRRIRSDVDRLPARLRTDVQLPAPGRPLQAAYAADAGIDRVTVGLEDRRADGSSSSRDAYVEGRLDGVPQDVAVVLDSTAGLVRSAEFHACPFDFARGECTAVPDALDAVDVLFRPRADRGVLPHVPDLARDHVALVREGEDFEVHGHAEEIREVVLRQRVAGGGKVRDPFGKVTTEPETRTVGVSVSAGTDDPFEAYLDQRVADPEDGAGQARSLLRAEVDRLPQTFDACIRTPRAAAIPEVADDPLLRRCEEGATLGSAASGHTPLSVTYDAPTTTAVRAHLRESRLAGSVPRVRESRVYVSNVPRSLRADVLLPADNPHGLGAPDRPLLLDYTAQDRIDAIDITHEDARTDGVPGTGDAFVEAALRGLPRNLGAIVDDDGGQLATLRFDGCSLDFDEAACDDDAEQLDRVTFAQRPRRSRAGLPPVPGGLAPDHLSILARGDEVEARAQVHGLRSAVFRQQGPGGSSRPDGVLGVQLGLTGRKGIRPFDARIDQDNLAAGAAAARTRVTAHVDDLPDSFGACVRQPRDVPVPEPPDDPDPLLEACQTDSLLGVDAETLREERVTPLAVQYRASAPTRVEAHVSKTAPSADDGGRPHVDELDATVTEVPSSLRVDVVPGRDQLEDGIPARKLRAIYLASDGIDRLDLGIESRRADSLCADPRPQRLATCLQATVHDIPKLLQATYDPRLGKGDIDLRALLREDGAPAPSIDGLTLEATAPGRTAADPSSPLRLTGAITGIPEHLTGAFTQVRDPEDPGSTTLGAADINACPDGPCDGVQRIQLVAENALGGASLLPTPPGTVEDVDQELVVLGRGDQFRASLDIRNLRRASYSLIDDDGGMSPTTTVRAAFGRGIPGEKLRAYVDRLGNDQEELVADATVSDLPDAIGLCFRDVLDEPRQTVEPRSPAWCARQRADRAAIQVALERPASGAKPDVKVTRFLMAGPDRRRVLTGNADIQNLGERIDVLSANEGRPAVTVEGRRLPDDGDPDDEDYFDTPLADVAGRITAEVQNYVNADEDRIGIPSTLNRFPWTPLQPGFTDPADDSRNDDAGSGDDPGGTNYVQAIADPYGRFYAKLSIPHVKLGGIAPEACEDDPRFPDPEAFGSNRAPEYSCVRASFAGGRPFGFSARIEPAPNTVLSVERGHLRQVPAGDRGFEATLSRSPEAASLDPWCGAGQGPPCRPPLLSVRSDRSDDQSREDLRLEARLATGARDLVDRLQAERPADDASRLLNYEERPSSFEEPGARVKVGTEPTSNPDITRSALRAGLALELPRYLSLYPPLSWSCQHATPEPGDCNASDVGQGANRGYQSSDLFFKLVGADEHPDGSDVDRLGRVALMTTDYGQGGSIVLTGAPDPDNRSLVGAFAQGASSVLPDSLVGAQTNDPSRFGAALPGHLDVRIQTRNDFNAAQDTLPIIAENRDQQHYTQVDGRINRPLSLSLRVNNTLQETRPDAGGRTYDVPGALLTAYRLPSTNGGDDYVNPSFRLRAELRPSYAGKFALQDPISVIKNVVKAGLAAYDAATGVSPVKIRPDIGVDVVPGWVDVKLNADPYGSNTTTSDDAARTVDVVAGPFGLRSEAELRGYAQVNGTGDGEGKGPSAPLTAQTAFRLTNLEFGLKGSVSFYGLVGLGLKVLDDLDIELGATAVATERLRLSQVINAVALRSGPSGPARVDDLTLGALELRVFFTALWGLIEVDLFNHTFRRFEQLLRYSSCPNVFDFRQGGFGTDDFDTAVAMPGFARLDNVDTFVVNTLVAAATVLTPITCAFHGFTSADKPLVTALNPAPRYAVTSHPVEGATPAEVTPVHLAEPTGDPRPDLVIDDDRTLCGALDAETLRVTSTGRLRVGDDGTVQTGDPSTSADDVECDGSLSITADRVAVDEGGMIEASAARVRHAGHGAGHDGAGAGHVGQGGDSGGGTAGGPSYQAPERDENSGAKAPSFGSHGGAGTDAAGGAGGGALLIAAKEDIVVDGTIAVDGGQGRDAAGCAFQAGGGGSAGEVRLAALRIRGTGTVRARGGRGGSQGTAGGGGSGGRITLDTITSDRPAHVFDQGGAGGVALPGCADRGGEDGDNGELRHEVLGHAGFVELVDPEDEGTIRDRDTVKLRVRAINDDYGGLDLPQNFGVVICRRSSSPNDTGFASLAIQPPPGAQTPYELRDQSTACEYVELPFATRPGKEAVKDIEQFVPDGYHGWFAMSAKPVAGGNCAGSGLCDFQRRLPQTSSATIGLDRAQPFVDGPGPYEQDGEGDCPFESLCLNANVGTISVPAADAMSGVASVECRLFPNPYYDCGLAPTRHIQLGGGDGQRVVYMRITDKLGHVTEQRVANWFVDTRSPHVPTVELLPRDREHNGWHHIKPGLRVDFADPNPSSGGSNAVTLAIDGIEDTACGFVPPSAAPTGDNRLVNCSISFTDPFIPTTGRHTVTGVAQDRAGNRSEAAVVGEIRLDFQSPLSQAFLAPREPDGRDGWYRTSPVVALRAVDNPGGSGVDARQDTDSAGTEDPDDATGIHWRDNNGARHAYAPDDPANTLSDGEHEVCWYAVDVAGNKEVNAQPQFTITNCRDEIRVDTRPPDISLSISPASPDGDGGWYRSRPTVTTRATDHGSGLSVLRRSRNGGTFSAVAVGAEDEFGDGVHEICAYADDVAGNSGAQGIVGGAPRCRGDIRVDATPPESVALALVPAQPDGDGGWYVTTPTFSVAAEDAGSGVRDLLVSVDGGPLQSFATLSAAQRRVADGVHTLCWKAVDVAGNARGGTGDPQACRTVRVDTGSPRPALAVTPDRPDGGASWYVARPEVVAGAEDPVPGSGLATVQVRLDGGAWQDATRIEVPEGRHVVEARGTDDAGNRSDPVSRAVWVDLSRPSARAETFPPAPGPLGWFRRPVRDALVVADGRDASGPDIALVSVDGATAFGYLAPFAVGAGQHSISIVPRDVAGLSGDALGQSPWIDLEPPTTTPAPSAPGVLLLGGTTRLDYTVGDARSATLAVAVVVQNALGRPVRRLDAGRRAGGGGSVTWDGRDDAGRTVLPGAYHFRVQAVDEAGNTAVSTESRPFVVAAGLL